MSSTRIIAFFAALAAVLAILSILMSCGGEKEPDFTVPTVPAVMQSEKAATESSTTEASALNTENSGTETTGVIVPAPIDFSTIPLPGEAGYTDHAVRKYTSYVGEDGIRHTTESIVYDEGFEDYPLSYLYEYYYATAYRILTKYPDELAEEPEIQAYVTTVWERVQGYRPIMFDFVSNGKKLTPLTDLNTLPMDTYDDVLGTMTELINTYFDVYDMQSRQPDGSYADAAKLTDEYLTAVSDYSAFLQSYYKKCYHERMKTALEQTVEKVGRYVHNKKYTRTGKLVAECLSLPDTPLAQAEYDIEKMKIKVTVSADGYDYCIFSTGYLGYDEEPSHYLYAKDVFWFDPASSSSFTYCGINLTKYVDSSSKMLYIGSKADLLPDRAASINSAALKSSVENFLGKTDPTVKDLTAIVGIEWIGDTLTLTDRNGNRKSYPSGGICRDTSTFDDFASISTLSIDASGLPDDAFTRNCFLSLDELTVTDCRADRLDLSCLKMLKTLIFRDCDVLRDVYLGEDYRHFYRFEFSGEKNKYIHTLDFLSPALTFCTLDISALSIDAIGGFRGCGYKNGGTRLVLGDMYDADFFVRCFNIRKIKIYGTAPSDEVIQAKMYEDKLNAYTLNHYDAIILGEIKIERY